MFDVGISELMVIGVVALIVIGPERLPTVARTVGHLLGRLQRYVNDVKADINREIHLDELKKMQQQVVDQVSEMQTTVNQELSSVETTVNAAIASVETAELTEPELEKAGAEALPAAPIESSDVAKPMLAEAATATKS